MPRSCLGPENDFLQNEADRSIFTSKFVFVLVKKSKQSEFFSVICFETSLSYRYLTYRALVLLRLGRHYIMNGVNRW